MPRAHTTDVFSTDDRPEPDDIPSPPVPESLKQALTDSMRKAPDAHDAICGVETPAQAALLAAPVPPVLDPALTSALTQALDDALLPALLMPLTTGLESIAAKTRAALGGLDLTLAAAVQNLVARHQGESQLATALATYRPLVPYSATVTAVSPAGFPVTLAVQSDSPDGLWAAIGQIMGMMHEVKFTAPQGIPF